MFTLELYISICTIEWQNVVNCIFSSSSISYLVPQAPTNRLWRYCSKLLNSEPKKGVGQLSSTTQSAYCCEQPPHSCTATFVGGQFCCRRSVDFFCATLLCAIFCLLLWAASFVSGARAPSCPSWQQWGRYKLFSGISSQSQSSQTWSQESQYCEPDLRHLFINFPPNSSSMHTVIQIHESSNPGRVLSASKNALLKQSLNASFRFIQSLLKF